MEGDGCLMMLNTRSPTMLYHGSIRDGNLTSYTKNEAKSTSNALLNDDPHGSMVVSRISAYDSGSASVP